MNALAVKQQKKLSDLVDLNRVIANQSIDEELRGKLGQFMSTSSVAQLLASMFENVGNEHRLLDAGAGVGSLTAAFVERVVEQAVQVESTTYELSDIMIQYLENTLASCAEVCELNDVIWNQHVFRQDFIEHAVSTLLEDDFKPRFNKAILNPPYLKIAAQGRERKLLRKVGFETGNLYSAFVGLSIKLLEEKGELVAITPRSFCNGPYFTDFRNLILETCSLNKIHVFTSRKSAFKADKVLQENIVFHLTKGERQREYVTITSSVCANDSKPATLNVPFGEVVSSNNTEKFIHVITSEEEREVAKKAGGLPCSLDDLGINASTGKVVDFRTRENLRDKHNSKSVPLIYPQHLTTFRVDWPKKDSKKPNAILQNESTAKLMVPNGTYVLTRRLTAKEEKRRIVASVYSPSIANVDEVGFENKTNYFHSNGAPLDETFAKGLCCFLNSTIVDKYFRQMNGHTQVNATDLRALRYPSKVQLLALGEKISLAAAVYSQQQIDNLIETCLF